MHVWVWSRSQRRDNSPIIMPCITGLMPMALQKIYIYTVIPTTEYMYHVIWWLHVFEKHDRPWNIVFPLFPLLKIPAIIPRKNRFGRPEHNTRISMCALLSAQQSVPLPLMFLDYIPVRIILWYILMAIAKFCVAESCDGNLFLSLPKTASCYSSLIWTGEVPLQRNATASSVQNFK